MASPSTPPTPTPILQVRDLCVSFRTRRGVVRAVDALSFDLHAGEILGVVGESGSGKSISMMSIIGLITDPNASLSGSIHYRGRSLLGLSHRELLSVRGKEIAMIFQDPMTALTPVYSIGWQIVEQIRTHERISAHAARLRAIELLGEVGLPAPAQQFERYPHQLSGGMRQRAVIAMALSCQPSVLIADEPTTALDVTVQAQILGLIQRLREQFGSSVILITHDLGVVSEVADRVMVMYAGRSVERGTTAELFNRAWHPYTWGLLGSIPPIDGPRPRRLPSIGGAPPSLLALPEGCAFAPRCAYRFSACARRPEGNQLATHDAACFLDAAARDDLRQTFLGRDQASV